MSIQPYNLGESGLKISPIIVGCLGYGAKKYADWAIEEEEEVFKILKKAYDVGLRTFDTADVYSMGGSEELLGKFIKKFNIPRDKIVIMTKVFYPLDTETPGFNLTNYGTFPAIEYANSKGLSRKHIFDAVQASVKRLGTFIDVLQPHRLDDTPKKEIMRALNDVIDQGFVRYIGASSMKAVEFAQLQFIAEQNGWHKFISMQNYYNLIYREEEREMIPFCQDNVISKVGVIPWSPLARGILARPLGVETAREKSDTARFKMLHLNELTDADVEIISRVEKVAEKKGVSMAVIATAWVLSKGCYPIVGLSSVERIDDIVKSLAVTFTDEELEFLEEPYVPKNVTA